MVKIWKICQNFKDASRKEVNNLQKFLEPMIFLLNYDQHEIYIKFMEILYKTEKFSNEF